MKVREKLTAGFLAVIVLMWVSVLFASHTYRSIHNEFEVLQGDIIPGALAMAEISETLEEIKSWSLVYMIIGNAERRGKTIEEWLQESVQSLETLAEEHGEQSFTLIADEAKTARELEDGIKRINPVIMRLVNLKNQGAELDELIAEREKTLLPILPPLQTQTAEHKAEHMAELVKSEELVRKAYTTGMLVLFIAAGVTGLMAAVAALLVTRSIVNPLHALHRGTEVIGEGNLDCKVIPHRRALTLRAAKGLCPFGIPESGNPVPRAQGVIGNKVGTKAKDEIGQLSRAFDRMTEGLRDNTVTIEALNKEIVERKQAVEALKDSEEKLRRMFDSVNDGITTADVNGVITGANRRVLEMHSYDSVEALIGRSAFDFIAPCDRERAMANSQKTLEEGRVEGIEYTFIRADGSEFPGELGASVLHDDSGHTDGFIAVTRDITERKQIEEDYENIFNLSPDIVVVGTAGGELVKVNPAWETILGHKTEDLLEMGWTTLIHPDDVERTNKEVERQLKGSPVVNFVNRYRCKDGSYKTLEWQATFAQEGFIHATARDITERKQAEEKLRESEERYRNIVELAPDSILTADASGIITSCNRAFVEQTGFGHEDIVGKHFTELPTNPNPEDTSMYSELFASTVAGEKAGSFEFLWKRKDGTMRWGDARAAVVTVGGEFQGAQVIMRDITERKQAEKTLRRSEENLRTYLEAAPDAVYISDLNGVFLYGNRKAEQITGYSRKELLGKSFFDLSLLPSQYLEKAAELLVQNEAGEPTGPDELELTRKDGSRVWVEISTTLINQGENTVVLGFVRDITERRQQEEEVLRLSSVVDSATEGVVITDLEQRITDCNRAFQEMTGYKKDEVIGKTHVELSTTEEDLPRIMEAIAELVSGKPVPTSDYTTICKDGTRLTTSVNLSLLKDRQGEIYGLAAILRDVTARRQTEEQLAQKTRELQASSQAKSEFLASMSHELRTPLNAVIGFSELLIDGIPGEVNEEQKECLADILTSGRHLLTLISDVLDISKVEAGKMELRPQNLDLADVINEVVQTIKPMADESRHEVVLSVPDDLPEAYADAGKVKQVLLNFLSNAVKFTPAGGRITVEATTTDDYCQVSVIDTGIGIKEEDQGRVFEVFVQGEALPDSTRKGTGLGLALARQFVELMEGRIWVESEYGKGSRFSFTIPRASDGGLRPGVAEEAEVKPSVVAGSSNSPPQKEVLVVDDDRKARSILRAWLEQEGYVVFEATDAEGGIKGAKELHPAVIVLDIMMPEKDGWQVLRELKSMPETRDIPVVITSILSEDELGFSLGAADYFIKPVDKERFLRRVAELGVTMDTTILVVDDNPVDAHLVTSMLKSDHIGAFCAYSGADGVRMANETEPDLIVLDLMMPDMNGFEVVDELRRQESTNGIPIIILTVKDLVDEELEALRRKTAAVIKKSVFTRESFLSEVRKVLDNSKVLGIGDEQG